ncbi:hypothetical protein GHT06_011203 [Daphnia sinensis]|uniref:Dendritic cell-specific transmembrane protein-like domain-containing protein n=1 Tax=Daphnia sinensis TaxID=1820382 RepID=A0AAD5L1V1_9CRUS|nr:hypothetical protein GHT06_011203 [Daphnia sinensis]
MLAVIILCLGLIAPASPEINFKSEHVLTVCDAFNVWHAQKGELIQECPQLPSAAGFFENLKEKLYEKQCETNITTPQSETSLLEHGILIVKQFVDSIKDGLEELGMVLINAAKDVSGLESVRKRWNHRVYSILAGSCFLLFYLHCRKISALYLNAILGFVTSAVFYFVRLYYHNWYTIWLLIAIAIFVGSPLYVRTWLPGLGAMTFIHLAIPLLNLVLRLIIETQLFLGPVLTSIINSLSILVHVFCLIGLYIDEKLLVVKVILLPFYQTFLSLFDFNGRHSELINSIRQSVDDMTTGFFSSTDFKGKSVAQLDEMLASRLRQLCVNVTTSWYSTCPVLFARSCTAYIDQTDIAKLDQGFDVAGQWLTSLILPSSKGTGSVQRTLSKQLCQQISLSACRAIDITAYCSPDDTFYGQAYHTFLTAVEKLKASIVVQPWLHFNFTLFDSGKTAYVSFHADWIFFGRRIASLCLVAFFLFILFRALIQSVFFLRRYRTDFLFCSEATGLSWKSVSNAKLMVKVLLFFLSEKAMKWMHEQLQEIQFIEPERGEARLAFNVQGNGTIASVMRSLFGGFSLQSKYCTKADSSVCITPFFPVGWSTWIFLFLLAGFYVLIGMYAKKTDYLMCRICGRFIEHVRRERKRVQQENSRRERLRKRLVSRTLDVKFALTQPQRLALNVELFFFATSAAFT